MVFFTLAHTYSHSCTHKIFHNIQKYVIHIVYILSTYSILLLLNVFGYIKITQIHNDQKSKISTHDDQSFSNSEISCHGSNCFIHASFALQLMWMVGTLTALIRPSLVWIRCDPSQKFKFQISCQSLPSSTATLVTLP